MVFSNILCGKAHLQVVQRVPDRALVEHPVIISHLLFHAPDPEGSGADVTVSTLQAASRPPNTRGPRNVAASAAAAISPRLLHRRLDGALLLVSDAPRDVVLVDILRVGLQVLPHLAVAVRSLPCAQTRGDLSGVHLVHPVPDVLRQPVVQILEDVVAADRSLERQLLAGLRVVAEMPEVQGLLVLLDVSKRLEAIVQELNGHLWALDSAVVGRDGVAQVDHLDQPLVLVRAALDLHQDVHRPLEKFFYAARACHLLTVSR